MEAEPLTSVTGLPKLMPSTSNCTVPAGLPCPDAAVTVAVNVSGSPTPTGFGNAVTAATDADGRYRLEGLPPDRNFHVSAVPPKGSPYIRRSAVAEAAGRRDRMAHEL